jgi:hypothetical protein
VACRAINQTRLSSILPAYGLVTAFASRGHPSSVYPGMNASFLLMSNACCLLCVIRGLNHAVAEEVKNSSKGSPNTFVA